MELVRKGQGIKDRDHNLSQILLEHYHYLNDPTRSEAYRRAVSEIIKPGDVVVDLGAGTGIMGLLACEAGAAHVYSIDNGGIIELARQVASDNGLQDRITFIKGMSTQVDLPEKVDVVIADQVGYFGFGAGILQYFSDAKKRFLKPDGKMIPSRIDLCLAPVQCQKTYQEITFWKQAPAGFNFSRAHEFAVNNYYKTTFTTENIIGAPVTGISLDLYSATTASFKFDTTLVIQRDGILHGLGGWFSAQLSPAASMTNSPVAENPIQRSQLFFPLANPVEVVEGDRINVTLRALPATEVISWQVEIFDGQEPAICKGKFNQNSWKGMLLSREDLHKSLPISKPQLSATGQARLTVLRLCDGKSTLSEIQDQTYQLHANLFHTPEDAAAFVTDLIQKHS